ncbi:MAG: hypothetical protein C4518_05880 [Desulfobacteraceae bacterium]|nr:MAG: hypothetical protein C4518_05880 [Desulfobacteraceae bacterium]
MKKMGQNNEYIGYFVHFSGCILPVNEYIPKRNGMLAFGDILLIAIALGVILLTINLPGRNKAQPSSILFPAETQRRRG